MERSLPTTQLILAITGGNQGLVSAAHHGLYEAPLDRLYTDLNLNEVIVFAATSWGLRSSDLGSFATVVRSGNIYEIFDYVNQNGFPKLNARKRIPEGLRALHGQLNPYKGRNLEVRLERVEPEAVQTLKEKLQRPVDSYPFKNPHEFAAEITEMISRYPIEYEPLTAAGYQPPKQQLSLPL